MFCLIILLFALLTTFTIAAPTPSSTATTCNAKVFNTPWLLTAISLYTPPHTNTTQQPPGWIRFNFIDTNPRLELETVCYADTVKGLAEPSNSGYIACADQDVSFKLVRAGMLMLERAYTDECLGSWPYNFGVAYGQNPTAMPPSLPGTAGTLRIQNRMTVPITAMG